MRKLLTILNIVLLVTLIVLSLYVFDVIDLSFLNGGKQTDEPLTHVTDVPDKVSRDKSYTELIQKGDLNFENKLYALAVDAYSAASEKEPDQLEPLIKIANIQAITANYEQAKALAEKILEKKPSNVDGKVILGRAYIGLEDFEKAKATFDSLTTDYVEALYYQGLMALYYGEYERARGLIDRVISSEVSEDLSAKSQKLKDAMNEFDKYQAGLHEHLKVLVARAMVQIDEPQMAKDLIWGVLKERRDYRDAWIILGYSYLKLEQYKDAADALEEAVRQDPEKPETFFYLGLAYAGEDKLNEAIEAMELAQKFGYEPKIHVEQKLAELYFQAEEYEKASDKYEEVISMNATDLNYFIRPVWVYIDKTNTPDKAVALAEKALIYHPEDSMSYNLLGWAQIANKDFINGNKNLQKALSLNPNFDAPYLNLGTMYEQQGQFVRAKELYKKAYELGNGSPVGNAAADKYNALLEKDRNQSIMVNVF